MRNEVGKQQSSHYDDNNSQSSNSFQIDLSACRPHHYMRERLYTFKAIPSSKGDKSMSVKSSRPSVKMVGKTDAPYVNNLQRSPDFSYKPNVKQDDNMMSVLKIPLTNHNMFEFGRPEDNILNSPLQNAVSKTPKLPGTKSSFSNMVSSYDKKNLNSSSPYY